jgi:sodium transport system permease protein
MRWSIIRTIWLRELRDQLRDRRTVFLIAVLPVLLYPLAGFGFLQVAAGYLNQRGVVGVSGFENLPRQESADAERARPRPYPPLLVEGDGTLSFVPRYLEAGTTSQRLIVSKLRSPSPGAAGDPASFLKAVNREDLDSRRVDLLLVVPSNFRAELEHNGRPLLFVLTRADEQARLMESRVRGILARWRQDLKEVRLARLGLPPDIDEPFQIYDPQRDTPAAKGRAEGLYAILLKLFPFVLVLWSLAGALYPAVDLCAGEKERGTMETLLISPAGREEIVLGKFLTIWVFSAATALLNLLSMGLTAWKFAAAAPDTAAHPAALLWGVLLLLPLSAFFSAVCLAVGAYARSSKEGQYYLMPLFFLTLPLVFLTLVPGVELNPFYSMVPVTGVALLLQRLMTAPAGDYRLWLYFVPVLAPMVIYSWLALRWAIWQFRREEVLFREAERLDLGLWLRRLFREKEALPNVAEAFLCFGLILGLRWLALNVGNNLTLLARTGISHLAFVATPPLLMAVVLTTQPARSLGLRRPPAWSLPAAAVLAVLLLPPLAELTLLILRQFPAIKALLAEYHPLTGELRHLAGEPRPVPAEAAQYFLVLAVLPAVCEELAFRGFILAGLRRVLAPWPAVLLSSFLFALYQMNVFQFAPHFLGGVVLAMLTVRSGSVLPAVVFHLVFNTLMLAPFIDPQKFGRFTDGAEGTPGLVLAAGCAALAVPALVVLWKFGRPRRNADAPEG